MSVYVGIDVHRKGSQVAVVDQAGQVLANRNVPNGIETVLKVIGDLPIGTPVAFEAAFGWGAGRAARRLWVRAAPGASLAVPGCRGPRRPHAWCSVPRLGDRSTGGSSPPSRGRVIGCWSVRWTWPMARRAPRPPSGSMRVGCTTFDGGSVEAV